MNKSIGCSLIVNYDTYIHTFVEIGNNCKRSTEPLMLSKTQYLFILDK
jgi:hypothetical protein